MVLGIASSGSLLLGIFAIIAGLLILLFPKLIRFFVGFYLIIAGILAILS